ncbi:MAG: alanine racemase [Lachnospiraceae bacterium]|nr:alanine racemase [Lachnospiraceae bacterium]
MKQSELMTPAVICNLDALEGNLKRYHEAAKANGKELWPMIKTHKSTEVARMQVAAGATGFLCGNLEEAEAVSYLGKKVMLAYPVASKENIAKAIEIAKKCDFYLRLDGVEAAAMIDAQAKEAGIVMKYTLIINAGLDRFGVKPEDAVDMAKKLAEFKNLKFMGISTHPGQVYAAKSAAEVPAYIEQEYNVIKTAVDSLKAAGFTCEIVSTGSTPTFWGTIHNEYVNVLHPGNYVFHDTIQMSIDVAKEEECAVYIYATVISHPQKDLYICDAGTKCFALDQGAHGNDSIKGYGTIKGHPELTMYALSEEVGKMHADGPTTLKVGDKIEVIPNHSCPTFNNTSYAIGVRGGEVERIIHVDFRENSTFKGIR